MFSTPEKKATFYSLKHLPYEDTKRIMEPKAAKTLFVIFKEQAPAHIGFLITPWLVDVPRPVYLQDHPENI